MSTATPLYVPGRRRTVRGDANARTGSSTRHSLARFRLALSYTTAVAYTLVSTRSTSK